MKNSYSISKLSIAFRYLLYPFKAIGMFFRSPRLFALGLVSVLLNTIVFLGLLVLLNVFSANIIENITDGMKFFDNGFVIFLTGVLRFVFAFFVLTVLYLIIAMPINSPIYSLMFNEVFHIEGIKENEFFDMSSMRGIFRRIGLSVLFEVKKLVVIIFVFIINITLSTLLNFIPVIGQILTVILQLLIFAFFGAIDIFEPVQTNNLFRFRDRMAFIFKNLHLFPFSLLGGFLISIPLVNILMLPIFVIAGIMVWNEEKL